MSMMTSTVPVRLNSAIAPSADRPIVTAFGVGAPPANQLRLDAFGLGTSAANVVMNDAALGLAMVMFVRIAVAVAGMLQSPLRPLTAKVTCSASPIGVARVPTLSLPARVSTNRHGVIEINDEATFEGSAIDRTTPSPVTPAAASAATAPMCTILNVLM